MKMDVPQCVLLDVCQEMILLKNIFHSEDMEISSHLYGWQSLNYQRKVNLIDLHSEILVEYLMEQYETYQKIPQD